jgi:acetyltransferase-like isoleucine patch superfamily enzyme
MLTNYGIFGLFALTLHWIHARLRFPTLRLPIRHAMHIGACNAWSAEQVCMLPRVLIDDGAVVGINAVVTRDLPPSTIVAGNPARLIRCFNDTSVQCLCV